MPAQAVKGDIFSGLSVLRGDDNGITDNTHIVNNDLITATTALIKRIQGESPTEAARGSQKAASHCEEQWQQ